MRTEEDFIRILEDFISRRISASDFERLYLKYYLRENPFDSGKKYEVLSKIFWDVEDYVDDPELRESSDLDEEVLRERCIKNLDALRQIDMTG